MKVKYNKNCSFDLPPSYGLDERLALIESILEDEKDKFTYTENQDTPYDQHIHRILDQFAYYLVSYKQELPNGKQLRNDTEILRSKKLANRGKREFSLFDFYSN